MKLGFINKNSGTIHLSIKDSEDGMIIMSVRDDGDGFPDGIDFSTYKGLGVKLVKHLVDGQLNGTVNFLSDDGTEVHVEFKRVE